MAPDAARLPVLRRELDRLAGELDRDTLENLRLLTTELVTNCLIHGRLREDDRIGVNVTLDPRLVRVDVHDPGPCFARRPAAAPLDRATQWGLVLVDRIADRWGIVPDQGCRVWFMLGRKHLS